jgi:hypothetical protein
MVSIGDSAVDMGKRTDGHDVDNTQILATMWKCLELLNIQLLLVVVAVVVLGKGKGKDSPYNRPRRPRGWVEV